MRWTLVLLAGATAFLTGVLSVRDHTALVRTGYEVSELERLRESLEAAVAHARARASYLGSPAVIAERAREFGLVTEYPREYAVEKVAPRRTGDEAFTAQSE